MPNTVNVQTTIFPLLQDDGFDESKKVANEGINLRTAALCNEENELQEQLDEELLEEVYGNCSLQEMRKRQKVETT